MARLGDVEVKCKECFTQMRAVPLPAVPNQLVHGQRRGQREGEGQHHAQSAVKVSPRQMWFDLAAGVSAEKVEQQPNEVLPVLWNQLRPDQQFTPIPGKATTREVRLADYLSD